MSNLYNPKASLPVSYQRATEALATCSKLDECKTWADKAAALESYGRQAGDDTLMREAQRIKARAIQRMGELLREIEEAKNQHDAAAKRARGDGSPSTRRDAWEAAGLSKDQAKQALRVAAVPAKDFERLVVKAEKPATLKALASAGTKHLSPKDLLQGRDPKEFAASTQAQGRLKDFVRTIVNEMDPAMVARAALPHEYAGISINARAAIPWLTQLIKEVEKKK